MTNLGASGHKYAFKVKKTFELAHHSAKMKNF